MEKMKSQVLALLKILTKIIKLTRSWKPVLSGLLSSHLITTGVSHLMAECRPAVCTTLLPTPFHLLWLLCQCAVFTWTPSSSALCYALTLQLLRHVPGSPDAAHSFVPGLGTAFLLGFFSRHPNSSGWGVWGLPWLLPVLQSFFCGLTQVPVTSRTLYDSAIPYEVLRPLFLKPPSLPIGRQSLLHLFLCFGFDPYLVLVRQGRLL